MQVTFCCRIAAAKNIVPPEPDMTTSSTARPAVIAAMSIGLLALLLLQGLATIESFQASPDHAQLHAHHEAAACSHADCMCAAGECNHDHGSGPALTSCGQQDLAAVASHLVVIATPTRSVSLLPPLRSTRFPDEASYLSDQTFPPAVFHPPRIG